MDGVVLETLPSDLYRVKCDDGRVVTASLGAAAKRVTIKVIPGDRVTIEISPIDPARGRIAKKLR